MEINLGRTRLADARANTKLPTRKHVASLQLVVRIRLKMFKELGADQRKNIMDLKPYDPRLRSIYNCRFQGRLFNELYIRRCVATALEEDPQLKGTRFRWSRTSQEPSTCSEL